MLPHGRLPTDAPLSTLPMYTAELHTLPCALYYSIFPAMCGCESAHCCTCTPRAERRAALFVTAHPLHLARTGQCMACGSIKLLLAPGATQLPLPSHQPLARHHLTCSHRLCVAAPPPQLTLPANWTTYNLNYQDPGLKWYNGTLWFEVRHTRLGRLRPYPCAAWCGLARSCRSLVEPEHSLCIPSFLLLLCCNGGR